LLLSSNDPDCPFDVTLMNPTLLWLLGLGAAVLAAWRVSVVRRRAADARAARENAAQVTLLAARKAALQPAPPASTPVGPGKVPASPAAADKPRSALSAEERASARAKAERVIAAEAARRRAAIQKAQNAARFEAERRAAEAARAVAATVPLRGAPSMATAAPIQAIPAAAPVASAPVVATPAAVAPAVRIAAAPAPAAAPAKAAPPPVVKTAAQTLVMLVDDSKMVRVKTSRLLASHEFQVVTAVDGLDAIRQLETCSPDLVITDVDMPAMDGFGLTNHLRGNARTNHIPIVMITSAEDRHRAQAQRVGVGLVLGKPYPEDELIAHIRSFSFVAKAQDAQALALA
jgi:CheY-like chemotaxis protein